MSGGHTVNRKVGIWEVEIYPEGGKEYCAEMSEVQGTMKVMPGWAGREMKAVPTPEGNLWWNFFQPRFDTEGELTHWEYRANDVDLTVTIFND